MNHNTPASDVICLEENSLLVLCGSAYSGKSHFARRWFRETEIVSLEQLSLSIFDHRVSAEAQQEALPLLYAAVEFRLRANRMTVVDAQCLQTSVRRHLVHLARHHQVPVYLLVMDVSLALCLERVPEATELEQAQLRLQYEQTHLACKLAKQEGFSAVFRCSQFGNRGPFLLRKSNPVYHKDCGPFDIIGDVHGCYHELTELLQRLGYQPQAFNPGWSHPKQRKLLFLGDLVDRGPQSIAVLWLATTMVTEGHALYVPGNHCDKLARYLRGNHVVVAHGLETTVSELEKLSASEKQEITKRFLHMYEQANPYLVLDQGRLLVAHAGLPEIFHGKMSPRIRAFALYGDVTGELDELGRPIRRDWSQDYRGKTFVAYGHTPVLYPRFINNSLNLDQGCVFGGMLSALRYPERELVSVPAKYVYWRGQTPENV